MTPDGKEGGDMKLRLNPEFFRRHLFVTVLMAGLGGWFAWDGLVRYPATPARELFTRIEKAEPPADADLEAFKAQKIQTQYGFAALALAAAAAVGLHLLAVARFAFAFDEDGFVWQDRRHAFAEITRVDDAQWEKKGITRIFFGKTSLALDAWHHVGVREFHERLRAAGAAEGRT